MLAGGSGAHCSPSKDGGCNSPTKDIAAHEGVVTSNAVSPAEVPSSEPQSGSDERLDRARQGLDDLCPAIALQAVDSGLNNMFGQDLAMACPLYSKTGGLFASHTRVSDSIRRPHDSSLGREQSMLSTAMHMVAACPPRIPGQQTPPADPLAPPTCDPDHSSLSVYVDKRQLAVDPLALATVPASTHAFDRSQALVSPAEKEIKGFKVGFAAASSITVGDSGVCDVPDAGGERVSFEIIEDEEAVQDLLQHASSGYQCSVHAVADACEAGPCAGGSGKGHCSKNDSIDGVAQCSWGIGDRMARDAGDARGDSPLKRRPPGLNGAEARVPGDRLAAASSCETPERSESVGILEEAVPVAACSPGGSAQASAARAGAAVAMAGQEVRRSALPWPNVRAMAAKVRQRVDSETAEIVRKCGAGASSLRCWMLPLIGAALGRASLCEHRVQTCDSIPRDPASSRIRLHHR